MKSPKPSSKISSQGEGPERVRLRLSSVAAADLEAIDAYGFEQFGDEAATAYMRRFDQLFALLHQHPRVGQPALELGKDMRSLMHRSHRILYKVDGGEVLIIRILQHAMDTKRALKGRMK